MKILSNYDGGSIDIEKIDNKSNTAYLKLKNENGKVSHYYNFVVLNEATSQGVVYISNFNHSMYHTENTFAPYVNDGEKWKRLSNENYTLLDSAIKFLIQPNSKIELSLAPRYTQKNLIDFCNRKNIKYQNDTLIKIELGNFDKSTIFVIGRQHPGETLSSFFIEGMINEIIKNDILQKNYHFIFFPIVNVQGVKNGNHRYVNGIDFNRNWGNAESPKEIKYLKKELKDIKNLEYFIDVHNDEITPNDYIRMKNPKHNKIAGIQVLATMGGFRRFARALIKQRKLINLKQKTAREYVEQNYTCKSILIELSMNDDLDSLYKKGNNFITNICK